MLTGIYDLNRRDFKTLHPHVYREEPIHQEVVGRDVRTSLVDYLRSNYSSGYHYFPHCDVTGG